MIHGNDKISSIVSHLSKYNQGDNVVMTSISDGQIILALIGAFVTSLLAVRLGSALYQWSVLVA